jgi:hypothetical protein
LEGADAPVETLGGAGTLTLSGWPRQGRDHQE